jgi:hypothetical protein
MFLLNTDVQKNILEFLGPKEIIKLYYICKKYSVEMFKEITTYTNFIIKCNIIIPPKYIHWFKTKNIELNLFKSFTKKRLYGGFIIYWFQNNVYHRIGGPAIIRPDGREEWYENGLLHRIGGPAIIGPNNNQLWYENRVNYCEEWYEHGLLHRNDGPAIKKSNGIEEWYENGLLHRNDGPAVIMPSNSYDYMFNIDGPYSVWYNNGLKHRIGGPAIIYANGVEEFWEYGKKITLCGLKKKAKRERKQNQNQW